MKANSPSLTTMLCPTSRSRAALHGGFPRQCRLFGPFDANDLVVPYERRVGPTAGWCLGVDLDDRVGDVDRNHGAAGFAAPASPVRVFDVTTAGPGLSGIVLARLANGSLV